MVYNQELQTYTRKAAKLVDGRLRITADRDPRVAFTSARMTSKQAWAPPPDGRLRPPTKVTIFVASQYQMAMYSLSNMVLDFAHAVQSRPTSIGLLSGRPLGNSVNLDLWDITQMRSLYDGISTVHGLFYEGHSQETIARLILCLGMQESTGDPALNAPSGRSQGFMQVSPGSVVVDFDTFGEVLPSPYTNLVPGRVNLTDPGTSVKLWGWYGNAAAHSGVSVAEYVNRDAWNIKAERCSPTLAHAILAWLAGPSADVSDPITRVHFEDYLSRIRDYWVASGFGSEMTLLQLLSSRLQGGVSYVRELPKTANTITRPFADTVFDILTCDTSSGRPCGSF